MLVFYSGQGEWCHICTASSSDKYLKKTVSIFTDGSGIFQLSKKSEKEIRYDGEAIVCGLLICADHEDRATPPQDIQDLEHGKTIFSLDTPKLFKRTDIINIDQTDTNDKEVAVKTFIQSIVTKYPDATSKDITAHCFECFKGNNRKLSSIKKILADLGIKHGGPGKRGKSSVDYMKNAPAYEPTQ